MHGNEQHVSKLQKKSKNIIIKKDNATLYQKQTRKKQKNKNKNKQTNNKNPTNKPLSKMTQTPLAKFPHSFFSLQPHPFPEK